MNAPRSLPRRIAGGMYFRISRWLHQQRLAKVHARHQTAHAADYAAIESILARFHAGGGLRHDYQAYKLWSLRRLLAARQPRAIVEFGTGSTSAVFADYAANHPDAWLTCVDESEQWLAHSRELSGFKSAQPANVEFIHCAKRGPSQTEPLASSYDFKSAQTYDFVFIDGPSLTNPDGTKNKTLVNTNVFELAARQLPETIVVDIRKSTVLAIQARLGDRYRCRVSDVIQGNLFDDYHYFTVFERQ